MPSRPAAFQKFLERANELGEDPVDLFLSAGLDYQGQSQMAYTANGWGTASEVTLDPGKIVGLHGEVGISGSVTRAKEALVIVQRGPETLNLGNKSRRNPQPLSLLSLVGVMWEGTLGAELSAGESFCASAGLNVTSAGAGKSASVKHSLQETEEAEEGPTFTLDLLGLGAKLEAKAGFGASGGYKYHHLYAEDIAPRFFPANMSLAREKLREMLTVVFHVGSLKEHVKKAACDFINSHSSHFGKVKYSTFFGHTGSATLIEKMETELAGLEQSVTDLSAQGPQGTPAAQELQAIILQARNHIGNLEPFVEGKKSRGLSFLRLTSHHPSAEAGFKASVSMSAQASSLLSAKAEVTLTGPTVGLSGKRAYMRYQSYFHDEGRLLLSTQDSVVNYINLDATLVALSAEAGVQSPIAGKGVSTGEVGRGLKANLGRMTYVSSIINWERPEQGTLLPGAKRVMTVKPHTGSGIRFGQSCLLSSLQKLLGGYDPLTNEFSGKRRLWYAERLADALNVTLPQLMGFLLAPEVASLIVDLARQDEAFAQADSRARTATRGWAGGPLQAGVRATGAAVLIESAFSVPDAFSVSVECTVRKDGLFSKGGEYSTQLKSDVREQLLKSPSYSPISRNKYLQALRLRYRIQDVSEDDSERFSLGFKVLDHSVGVKLRSVDRAGAEGLVDLATVWMKAGEPVPSSMNPGSKASYERGVPPAVLFCQ